MANRYWVGGSGNWDASTTTHWAASSGGAGGQSVPTSSDNVFFDEHSNEPDDTDYTVTLTAIGYCLNLTITKPPSGNPTIIYSGQQIRAYGNISLLSTMTLTANNKDLIGMYGSSGTQTLATNGISIQRIYLTGASTKQLTTDLTLIGSSAQFQKVSSAVFDANGKKVTISNNIAGQNIVFYFDSDTTFYDLTITGVYADSKSVETNRNITVTNNLVINGNSGINRLLIKSNTLGTQRTITAANVTITNADFRDIKGAGAGSWDLSAITGGSGDCGGNTDITFTTADDWYWHEGTGKFSDYSKWYTATNGGGSQMASTRVPLPQDTCYFDANSFDSGSQTVTQDMIRMGGVNWNGVTNTPTFTVGAAKEFYGSIKLVSGMTFSNTGGTNYFYNRGNITVECGGKSFGNNLQIYAIGGEVKLSDKFFTTGNVILTLNNGTFDANNQDLYISQFASSNSNTRSIKMGSGTWELYGKAGNFTIFNLYTSTGLTFDAGTSTIKLSFALDGICHFYGGGKTFYNIWNATTNNSSTRYIHFRYNETWNDFKIDAGCFIMLDQASTHTVTTFTTPNTGTPINIRRDNYGGNANAILTKVGGGTISCDYIDIDYITGNPDTTWYMGTHSTDGGHNSQIYFTDPPSSTATGNFFQLF